MSEAIAPAGLRPRVALELLKPLTWFPPVWAFGCGALSAGGREPVRWGAVAAGLLLAGPLVCGASQAVNDWFDRGVDALNEPGRPVPSGRAPGRSALNLALGWSLLALLVGAALGPFVRTATVVGLGLAWAYSAPPLRLKADGWLGPAAVGLCYEGLAWMTGAATAGGRPPSSQSITLALLYSVGAIGIMVLNDFKSVEGDRAVGLKSVPVLLGPGAAARAACAIMAAAQAAVAVLLAVWAQWAGAAGVVLLLAAQAALMPRLLRDPRGRAPWYNGTGTGLYVLGMLVSALALRGVA